MAAINGDSNNLLAGTRELDLVTNTYAGYLESAGVAYNLVLPFAADKLELWNYTKFATNDQNLSSVWFRDFPAADALIIRRATTTLTSTLETANGVTVNDTAAAFSDEHVTIIDITTATPGVVEATAHGLSNLDRVMITKLTGDIGDELNNRQFVVQNVTTNKFELNDPQGNAITVAATYAASAGQINKMFASGTSSTENTAAAFALTLGTAVIGADSDVIYFVATKFNVYFNLGDIV